jgi:hypothetical protein
MKLAPSHFGGTGRDGKIEKRTRMPQARKAWGAVGAGRDSGWLPQKGVAMEGLREFLSDLKRHGYAKGNFLGLLNVLIGRQIASPSGVPISEGLPWRLAAEILKRVRWDKEAVREVGLDPAALPPRDRYRYWYLTISQARVDSAEAMQAGDRLAKKLREAGYRVGKAPTAPS